MCCKHNVLFSLFCALLLSDVYIAAPFTKQPSQAAAGMEVEARRCAPWFPVGKMQGPSRLRTRLAGPFALWAGDWAVEAGVSGSSWTVEQPRRQRGGKGRRGEEGRRRFSPGEQNERRPSPVPWLLRQLSSPSPKVSPHQYFPPPLRPKPLPRPSRVSRLGGCERGAIGTRRSTKFRPTPRLSGSDRLLRLLGS